MNPYRILKTDNGYEIVRVSYDEDGRPKSMAGIQFVSASDLVELERGILAMLRAYRQDPLTYADFKREG